VGVEVPMCRLCLVQSMYEDATTMVRVNGRDREAFGVRVGVHQGSVLGPLLLVKKLCQENLQ